MVLGFPGRDIRAPAYHIRARESRLGAVMPRRTVDPATGEITSPRSTNRSIDHIDHIYDLSTSRSSLLGTTAKSVASPSAVSAETATNLADATYQERRTSAFALQNVSRRLLPDHRVANCMRGCGSAGVVVKVSPSAKIAAYDGVVTCGSVWVCPVCTRRISNGRRAELNRLLKWGRSVGQHPLLLTLTVSHRIDDQLASSLDKLKSAKRAFHQSHEWKALSADYLAGFVTATEITYGSNGWHPHFHMLLLLGASDDREALQLVEEVRPAWERALENRDLWCNEHGFLAQGASNAGEYVVKWGAAEELVLTSSKTGRQGGRSPWALLKDAYYGDAAAGDLFVEYARCFTGRHQLVWADGLKKQLGLAEQSDEDLAAAPELTDLSEVALVSKALWKLICARMLQAELLDVAEAGGADYIEAWLQALELQESLKGNVDNA